MNPTTESPGYPRGTRAGTTLMEVLVACGILVVGLASVAALLPAAASVLADASLADRAQSLSTNAVADLQFRGMLQAGRFPSGVRAMVYGGMFPASPFGQNPFRRETTVDPTPLDEQAYGPAWYGAVVAPMAAANSIRKGTLARVTVVVFKRRNPTARRISLQVTGPGVFRLVDGSVSQQDADRRRFLPPCSWVAVVHNGAIHWLRIGTSWSMKVGSGDGGAEAVVDPNAPDITDCLVGFADPVAAAALVSETGDLVVHAFEGLVRLEEHVLALE